MAQELKDNPGLAEEILSLAGKMSLAYMAVKIREVSRENEKLTKQLANTNSRLSTTQREIEALTEKCRKLQTNTKQSIELLQNQIKPAASSGKS